MDPLYLCRQLHAALKSPSSDVTLVGPYSFLSAAVESDQKQNYIMQQQKACVENTATIYQASRPSPTPLKDCFSLNYLTSYDTVELKYTSDSVHKKHYDIMSFTDKLVSLFLGFWPLFDWTVQKVTGNWGSAGEEMKQRARDSNRTRATAGVSASEHGLPTGPGGPAPLIPSVRSCSLFLWVDNTTVY